jgi:tetratricopeptide (TPR) repeat protein
MQELNDSDIADISDLASFIAMNKQSLSELLTFVDFAEGLTIGFIEIDREKERDWIIEWLINLNHPQCQNAQFLVLTYKSPDLRFLLDEILKSLPQDIPTDKNLVLIIRGLEYSIGHTEYPSVLQNLNFVRDAFIEAVPYPILFCLPSYQITSFANYAPDFWAWKSGLFKFEFVETVTIFVPNLPVDYSPTWRTPEPQSRIDLLEGLLAEYSASSHDRNLATVVSILQQLGSAHRSRKEWKKAEKYQTEALKIIEKTPSFSISKTNLLIELADVYREQRQYNIAEKLCRQVLIIERDHLSPQQSAEVHNTLGLIYVNNPHKNIVENLENAISFFESALKIYTHDDFPQEWAQTQNNLGIAYRRRIQGNRTENREMSIECFQSALRVLSKTAFPQQWAMTQNSLGIAYKNRIRGNRAENQEMAIECFKLALNVRTETDFPQDWAQTQNNLATVYAQRIRGNQAENLEMAIECYQNALKIRTETDFPQQWAMTQNNLGLAYTQRSKGEKAENIKKAIECYQNALKIYTPDTFPREWEQTQNLLQAISPDFPRSDCKFVW